jgi:hypothetical protein
VQGEEAGSNDMHRDRRTGGGDGEGDGNKEETGDHKVILIVFIIMSSSFS